MDVTLSISSNTQQSKWRPAVHTNSRHYYYCTIIIVLFQSEWRPAVHTNPTIVHEIVPVIAGAVK